MRALQLYQNPQTTSLSLLGLNAKPLGLRLKLSVSYPFSHSFFLGAFFFFDFYFYYLVVFVGLEINERPLKRPLLDFEKLSISSSSGIGKQVSISFPFVFFHEFKEL